VGEEQEAGAIGAQPRRHLMAVLLGSGVENKIQLGGALIEIPSFGEFHITYFLTFRGNLPFSSVSL
jgi:hypothetical protein